jgi:hypothetical protein
LNTQLTPQLSVKRKQQMAGEAAVIKQATPVQPQAGEAAVTQQATPVQPQAGEAADQARKHSVVEAAAVSRVPEVAAHHSILVPRSSVAMAATGGAIAKLSLEARIQARTHTQAASGRIPVAGKVAVTPTWKVALMV